MGRIFYSVAGDGRGHATRAATLVEALLPRHQVVVFASHDAFAMLQRRFAGRGVRVVRIPGLLFHYTRKGRHDYLATACNAARFVRRMARVVRWLADEIERDQPDLAISDFEPLLPRAAARAGLPLVSVDHQNYLVACDLSALPRTLRFHAAYMGVVVRLYGQSQQQTVVSSFYHPPLKPRWREVRQVGVLLRPELRRMTSIAGDGRVCAYVRRHAPPALIDALRRCGRRVHLYGLGSGEADGNIVRRGVSESAFLEDLACCDALVTTAGNQLVGEAIWLGKPVFAMPETGNYEQHINGYYLRASGGGVCANAKRVTAEELRSFLAERERYRLPPAERARLDGTAETQQLIEHGIGGVAGVARAS